MSPPRSSRSLLGLLLAMTANAAILPRQSPTAGQADFLQPWVTIAADGAVRTITPTVTTVNGAATTLSTFPGEKTSAPIANANGEAAFLVCSNLNGRFQPWCSPDSTSRLETGNTYYITWDPDYFENAGLMLTVQADMAGSDEGSTGGKNGMLIADMRTAADGFARWDLTSDWLPNGRATNLSLFFVMPNGDSTQTPSVGPRVQVFPGRNNNNSNNNNGGNGDNNTVRIALAAVFSVVGLALVLATIWYCRRKRSGQGYGIRKSRIQRLSGTATKGGIRMDNYGETLPRGPPPAQFGGGLGGGQNAFREEIRRQGRDVY